MLTVKKTSDIWTALYQITSLARTKSIACILKNQGEFYLGYSDKMSAEAITTLQTFEVILLVVEGKPTKSKLSDAEREYWTSRIRESNAWLN